MRRRTFISLVSGVVAWPLAARGQQSGKLPTLGFLGSNNSAAQSQMIAVFLQRLRDLGWTEGRTIAIEYRWAEGRAERAAQIAADFVRLKVDVILTSGTENVIEVKQATSTIPIVFAAAADPVSTGLVASLAKPAGNITGLSTQQTDLAGKRIELLREAVPGLRRLGVLVPGGSPGAAPDLREVQASARALSLETVPIDIRGAEDITRGFETLGGHVDGLYIVTGPLITTHRLRINTLALGARLPAMHGVRDHVEAAGLMSYGISLSDLFRRSADYVDKILRGAKPGDIPVEQPTKFDLVINLITAKALGIEIPATLLARADEVIE